VLEAEHPALLTPLPDRRVVELPTEPPIRRAPHRLREGSDALAVPVTRFREIYLYGCCAGHYPHLIHPEE
jgi:hypothetical protein